MRISSITFRFVVWCIGLIFGITSFSLIIAYVNKYSVGGFDSKFNIHAFVMTFGLIFLNGEALTIYRMIPNKKPATKYTHGAIQCLVFMMGVAGVNAIFQAVGDEPMDSLHAWVGIGTLVLFTFQLIFGFVIFTIPGIPERLKSVYLRIHVVFGIGILLLATVAAVLGMNLFAESAKNLSGFSGFSEPVLMMNFAAICAVIFTGCVVYIVSEHAFRVIPESPYYLCTAPFMSYRASLYKSFYRSVVGAFWSLTDPFVLGKCLA